MANYDKKRTLMNELSQGKELTRKLMEQLQKQSSLEEKDLLVSQIISSYEKALSVLNYNPNNSNNSPRELSESESPRHLSLENSSPRSVFFDQEDSAHQRQVFKKKKTTRKWSEKVKVCLATGIEGPIEDGHSWRKYGQKDILGSTHPRGYYRCTHRNTQGCLATKQVQKSNEDSTIFEVTYRGQHTCCTSPSQQPSKHCFKQEKVNLPQLGKKELIDHIQPQPQLGLEIKTEGSNNIIFPSLSLPIESSAMDNAFLSGSNHNFFADFESDLTEMLSTPTSIANSPNGHFEFTFEDMDFESNFPFETPKFCW